jgi:hypothetical protein
MLSGLFLAEMSLDRLLAVTFPMKVSSLCTTARAKVIVLVTSAIILVANIHLFYVMKYVFDRNTGKLILDMKDGVSGITRSSLKSHRFSDPRNTVSMKTLFK